MVLGMMSKRLRFRVGPARKAGATLCLWCVVAFHAASVTGCGNAGSLLSTVGGDDGSLIDPIDLSGDGDATCDTTFVIDGQGFGFNLSVLAVEAAGQVLNEEADFAGAWSFPSDGVEVIVSAEVNGTDFPASLALLVATANAEITEAGGTVSTVVELILSNGDAGSQTNFVQDGIISYRIDVTKNEKIYTLTASAPQAELTQTADNAMIATVTSLCVD